MSKKRGKGKKKVSASAPAQPAAAPEERAPVRDMKNTAYTVALLLALMLVVAGILGALESVKWNMAAANPVTVSQ